MDKTEIKERENEIVRMVVSFCNEKIDSEYASLCEKILFDKSFEPYLTLSEIHDYFGTSSSTVSQKAGQIRTMLKLHRYWEPEFSKILHHEWLEDSEYINPDNVARDVFGDWNHQESVLKAANYCNEWREK